MNVRVWASWAAKQIDEIERQLVCAQCGNCHANRLAISMAAR